MVEIHHLKLVVLYDSAVDALESLRGNCAAMVAVKDKVRRLLEAPDTRRLPPILIQGETGTGKGLLARGIHAASRRSRGPFVDVNSAAIPESLLEAELFGFERGAFTDARQAKVGLFQAAHQGTIFLDEIGLLSTTLQGKLLKVIEERAVRRLGTTVSTPVDVWIVAATNEALQTAVRERRFREDLFYRLGVFTLELPPLRERGDDIILLAEGFLGATCAAYGLPAKAFTPEARAALIAHRWPGNVRELSNVIERVALLADERCLTPEMLGLSAETIDGAGSVLTAATPLPRQIEVLEQHELLRVLEETRWNLSQAADRLGLTRNMMRYRVDKYGLRRAAARAPLPPQEPNPLAPPPTPRTEKPVASSRWERRLVAVLQATVSSLAETEGGNEVSRCLDLLVDKVQSFAGRIEEASPSGIVASFGLEPTEDAPRHAGLAALAIQEARSRWPLAEGSQRAVRIAIHADYVTVGQIGGRPEFESVAKRQLAMVLEELSTCVAPDSIAVSQTARGFLRRRFEFTEQVAHEGPPILGGRLTGYHPLPFGPSGYTAAAAYGLTTFVGRDAEMELLFTALEQATVGKGQVVAVVGEPGVGKSRLLWEFTHSHRTRGCLVLEAASVSYGMATTYLPVIELLKGYFGIEARDDGRRIREKVTGKLLSLDRALEGCLAPLLWLLDVSADDAEWERLDPPLRRQRLREALRRLLLRESQVQPVVLVVEDLHWIDGETQAFLDQLMEALPTARLLVLVNYRPEYRHAWGSKTYYRQLRIDPLSAASADQLLAALLGPDPSLIALRPLLIARTEGNPFFLEESVQSLVETGALAGDRGAYRLMKSPEALGIPATVQTVLAARIDRLSPEDKRLLQTASVVGKDVPDSLLRAIADADDTAVQEGLARLQAAEFLYEVQLFPEHEYTFKHALTHEVAYGGLLQDRRRALHARIIAAIEAGDPARLAEQVGELARHAVRGEVWDKAVHYCRQVGAKSFDRRAFREAAAAYEQALDALGHLRESPDTDRSAVELRRDLAQLLILLGEYERALVVLGQAEAQARTLDDRARLGRVLSEMSFVRVVLGNLDGAIAAARESLEIATALGDPVQQASVSIALARACLFVGDPGQSADLLRRNVETVPLGPRNEAIVAIQSRAWLARVLGERGEFREGQRLGEEALRLAAEDGRAMLPLLAHGSLMELCLTKGDWEAAIEVIEAGRPLSRTSDDRDWSEHMAAGLGLAYGWTGRFAEGLALLEETLNAALQRRAHRFALIRALRLSTVYLLAGRLDEARQHVHQALDLARQRKARGAEAQALVALGEVHTHASPPDVQQAETAYREALALAEPRGMRPVVAHCHLGLGKLCRRSSQLERAHEHLTTAVTMYREMDMRSYLEQAEAELKALH
jgi:DNA-binding NtrC family response regulator/tetratricopeptide (TPR) repeat protein